MDQNETIALYHPILYSIAYKIMGSAMDAEDMVQETFLKWLKTEKEKIENTKAYLIRAVTNTCITHLNQLNRKKETLVDFIHHSNFLEKMELPNFDVKNEFSEALAVVMKKLDPTERAVFLLREIFNIDYNDLTEIVDKKKENCRQLLSRAKDKLNREKEQFQINLESHTQFVEKFWGACTIGELNVFIEKLKKDIGEKFN